MVRLSLMYYILYVVNIYTVLAYDNAHKKLQVTVYYESKCPDSRKFVTEQLQPTIKLLKQDFSFKLVPFGKAYSIDYGLSGFECQHGQSECLGNMIQDCALHVMAERSDIEKVDYVACEMTTLAGTVGNLDCVQKANVDPDLVHMCLENGKGSILQLESEYATALVKPAFIPTVTIDGEFNQHVQNGALYDLLGSLCTRLPRAKPYCANYFNNLTMGHILSRPNTRYIYNFR